MFLIGQGPHFYDPLFSEYNIYQLVGQPVIVHIDPLIFENTSFNYEWGAYPGSSTLNHTIIGQLRRNRTLEIANSTLYLLLNNSRYDGIEISASSLNINRTAIVGHGKYLPINIGSKNYRYLSDIY